MDLPANRPLPRCKHLSTKKNPRLPFARRWLLVSVNSPSITNMEAPSKKSSSKDKKKSKTQKSGIRTKFLIESLRNDYYSLREENERLRGLVTANLRPEQAEAVLASCFDMNAPRAKVDNIDALAEKMAGSEIDDDDDEE